MTDGLIALLALLAVMALYRLLALGAPRVDEESAGAHLEPRAGLEESQPDVDAAA